MIDLGWAAFNRRWFEPNAERDESPFSKLASTSWLRKEIARMHNCEKSWKCIATMFDSEKWTLCFSEFLANV
jgi:hypothetical protein